MVDLPLLPERITTTEAPQSAVSRGDIAGQYDAMAGALSKVADATDTIAVKMAKEQAAEDLQKQKVTRDADGNVSVENPISSPLIFGRAGEVYHQAVTAGTIAQHSNIISQEMNDMHQQYPTDAAAFNKAADSWKARYLQDHGGGEVGLGIQQQADQLQAQHSISITNTGGKIQLAKDNSSLEATQVAARNDVMTMLRNGLPYQDKAVQSGIARYDSTVAAREANPLFAYSKEQADNDRKAFQSEAQASRFLYNTDHLYKDQSTHEETQPDGSKVQVANGGAGPALRYAEDILTNPKYSGLTPEQRELYFHRAAGEIRTVEALRHSNLAELRTADNELALRSAAHDPIEYSEVNRHIQAHYALGDPGGAAELQRAWISKPLNDAQALRSIPAQTADLNAIRGVETYRPLIEGAAQKYGIDPIQLARQIHQESGINPNVRDSSAGAQGIAQFMPATAVRYGVNPRDPASSIEGAAHYMADLSKQFGGNQGLALAGYNWGEGNVTKWLASGANPAAMPAETRNYVQSITGQSIQDWTAGKQPATAAGLSPAGSLWLAANRTKELDKKANAEWAKVMDDYGKEGTKPALQTVRDVIDAATATNNLKLLRQITDDAARMDLSGEQARTSIPSQQANITMMAALGQTGNLKPGMGPTEKDLTQVRDGVIKGLNENPQATVSKFYSDKFPPLLPLDFSNDANLAAGISERGRRAQFAAQNWQPGGAVSALDAPDVAQFKAMVASPDPAVKIRAFNALSTLPEDVKHATLAKIGKDDPEMMVSVGAGSMMRTAPEIGASILRGQAAIKMDKGYLPKGAEKTAFDEKLNKEMPPSMFTKPSRTDPTGIYATGQGMIQARYAALSADAGDTKGKLVPERLQRAVDNVTGGIVDHNGGKLIAPERNMGQPKFDRVMNGLTDADLPGVTTAAGQPVTADYLRNRATLETFGDGRYLVRLGKDAENPIYAYTGTDSEVPQKFILDLRNRPLGPLTPPATTLDFMAAPATPFVRPPGAPTITGTGKSIVGGVARGAKAVEQAIEKLAEKPKKPLKSEDILPVGTRG